jgi:hypothetical protein
MQSEKQNTSSITMDRSPNAVAMDNLVRRKLRVSDPTDAGQIADALRKIYKDESHALDQEAAGVPFLPVRQAPPTVETSTATGAELTEAINDVNRDLTSLTNNALLKDVHPELNGWATAIRSAIADGANAARFSLDPHQRDKAFSVRRLLGGYARVARYVGALTPTQNLPYRRLAQSLDEVANVILVLMGDALANVGYSGGRFLLQAPASELQGRRDAVIYALRNLTGSVQEGYGPNEWPRGLLAYRQFINRLETSGQTDLRSLFVENHIAKIMDDLLHWTTNGSADDLRALGSTAHLALEQVKRLIRLGQGFADPESPPLASFFSALQLFVDAFLQGAIGHRLLYISRPPIVFYGLYGFGDLDDPTKRLLALIQARGNLAHELDCYLGCDCSQDNVECQIKLDKILYDVDRAIDLYTLATAPKGEGEPEYRAAAYGFLIAALLYEPFDPNESCDQDPVSNNVCKLNKKNKLKNLLQSIIKILWLDPEEDFGKKFSVPNPDENGSTHFVSTHFGCLRFYVDKGLDYFGEGSSEHNTLSRFAHKLNQMHQELCIQRDLESEWENMLETMAPSCIRFKDPETPDSNGSGTILATQSLIGRAIKAVKLDQPCPEFEVDIPRHFESSLETLVNDRPRTGN